VFVTCSTRQLRSVCQVFYKAVKEWLSNVLQGSEAVVVIFAT
jgi:hypothetical protein